METLWGASVDHARGSADAQPAPTNAPSQAEASQAEASDSCLFHTRLWGVQDNVGAQDWNLEEIHRIITGVVADATPLAVADAQSLPEPRSASSGVSGPKIQQCAQGTARSASAPGGAPCGVAPELAQQPDNSQQAAGQAPPIEATPATPLRTARAARRAGALKRVDSALSPEPLSHAPRTAMSQIKGDQSQRKTSAKPLQDKRCFPTDGDKPDVEKPPTSATASGTAEKRPTSAPVAPEKRLGLASAALSVATERDSAFAADGRRKVSAAEMQAANQAVAKRQRPAAALQLPPGSMNTLPRATSAPCTPPRRNPTRQASASSPYGSPRAGQQKVQKQKAPASPSDGREAKKARIENEVSAKQHRVESEALVPHTTPRTSPKRALPLSTPDRALDCVSVPINSLSQLRPGDFLDSAGSSVRVYPQRVRMIPLETWRNERVKYVRPEGSIAPHIGSVEFNFTPKPSAPQRSLVLQALQSRGYQESGAEMAGVSSRHLQSRLIRLPARPACQNATSMTLKSSAHSHVVLLVVEGEIRCNVGQGEFILGQGDSTVFQCEEANVSALSGKSAALKWFEIKPVRAQGSAQGALKDANRT